MNKTIRTHTNIGLHSSGFNLLLQFSPGLVQLLCDYSCHIGLGLQLDIELLDGVLLCGHFFRVSGEEIIHLVLEQSSFLLLLGKGGLKSCNLRDQVFLKLNFP